MIDMLEQDANSALRRVISGQGIHPSEFTLLSYGGSGPLHLAGCSRGIGFRDIITFQFAAAFSAFGCTTADYMRRHSVSTQIDIPTAADDGLLAAIGRRITADLGRSRRGRRRRDDGRRPCPGEDHDGAVPDDALHRPARGCRGAGAASSRCSSADDMRATLLAISRQSTPRSTTACRAMARPASPSPSSASSRPPTRSSRCSNAGRSAAPTRASPQGPCARPISAGAGTGPISTRWTG